MDTILVSNTELLPMSTVVTVVYEFVGMGHNSGCNFAEETQSLQNIRDPVINMY